QLSLRLRLQKRLPLRVQKSLVRHGGFFLMGLNLHQLWLRSGTVDLMRGLGLGVAPEIDQRCLMNAGNGAVGSAGFLGEVLAPDVGDSVIRQRDSGIAALLGAVVNQAVLADIEIAGAGSAAPVVGLA